MSIVVPLGVPPSNPTPSFRAEHNPPLCSARKDGVGLRGWTPSSTTSTYIYLDNKYIIAMGAIKFVVNNLVARLEKYLPSSYRLRDRSWEVPLFLIKIRRISLYFICADRQTHTHTHTPTYSHTHTDRDRRNWVNGGAKTSLSAESKIFASRQQEVQLQKTQLLLHFRFSVTKF